MQLIDVIHRLLTRWRKRDWQIRCINEFPCAALDVIYVKVSRGRLWWGVRERYRETNATQYWTPPVGRDVTDACYCSCRRAGCRYTRRIICALTATSIYRLNVDCIVDWLATRHCGAEQRESVSRSNLDCTGFEFLRFTRLGWSATNHGEPIDSGCL